MVCRGFNFAIRSEISNMLSPQLALAAVLALPPDGFDVAEEVIRKPHRRHGISA